MSRVNLILVVLLIALTVGFSILYRKHTILDLKYRVSVENIKAYDSLLSSLKTDNRVFKFNIQQLTYYNDSILLKMNSVRRLLNIKDKEIKSMLYMLTLSSRVDTLVFRDTLFVNNLNIDTVLGDMWYSLELSLKYPSLIVVSPTFNSEKYINTHDKRETIDPPKKFFLLRWFQKKHTIRVVDVYEKSPYSKIKLLRFVEIVKD